MQSQESLIFLNSIQMKNISSADTLPFARWLLIPYVKQLIRISKTPETENPELTLPRFQLFRTIPHRQSSSMESKKKRDKKEAYKLLWALMKAHWQQIFVGFLICLLWTLFNTLTPKIVKQFFRLMKDTALEGQEIHEANYLTQKFILLQLLRILTSANTKRLFGQLSIKVTAALSIELTQKALRLSHDCRQLLPESQIYQMENTDMKAIAHLFNQLWVITDIPFTVAASIILLFSESVSFGIMGIYWILLIFFLQRWICDMMIKSTNKKLRLTEQRSKMNYELMQKMTLARLEMSENYFVEKNNDFFLTELAEYKKFHHLLTSFDLTLILMPLVFVISIAFYDLGESSSFTIQQVFMLMTLIGLCYRPFKNLKKFTLTFSEAMYSLKRFGLYLNLPEKKHSFFINNLPRLLPFLKIKPNTMSFSFVASEKNTGFYFSKEIQLKAGERLIVLGKKGQGNSQFLKSILGQFDIVHGEICFQGSFAYLPRENFFSNESICSNISFYDSSVSLEQIKTICQILGLDEDLELKGGLSQKLKVNALTEIELKKIGLARVLCSRRRVLVLDCPFLGLPIEIGERLQNLLRKRQESGAMVIIAERYIKFLEKQDRIAIVSQGQIQQYGTYQSLLQSPASLLSEYSQPQTISLSDKITCLNIVREFQRKILKLICLSEIAAASAKSQSRQNRQKMNELLYIVGKYSLKLKQKQQSKKVAQKKEVKSSYRDYAWKVVKFLPFGDWGLAVGIILVIELLNIFIQYQFGNEYKHGGKNKLSSLRGIMKYELVLTICLAVLIYLQREIQFCISFIIGNHVYRSSLGSITTKKMSWLQKSHSSLIAHKFNHDYDEIFSAVHFVFQIVKSTIILITTILSIDAAARTVGTLTIITSALYYSLLKFFRNAEEAMIRCYPQYKYQFVKVFDEIIEGAQMINIFDKRDQAINKAKLGFTHVATYKLVAKGINIAEQALCQLSGTLIIALGLEYGTKMKLIEGDHNQALVAVSVMLLLNLSDVLKTMLKMLMKLQILFRTKLISYIELINLNPSEIVMDSKIPLRYGIEFKERLLQAKEDNIFQIYPLSLKISDNEKVLLLEKNPLIRKNILLALTNNLVDPEEDNRCSYVDVIKIGDQLVKHMPKQYLKSLVAPLLSNNFYFTGTLRANLQWKTPQFNIIRATLLAQALNISQQLPDFETKKLEVVLNGQVKNRELSRKIALLKILLKKPKVVIIKDTPWIVGSKDVVSWLKQQDIQCAVIGISESPIGVRETKRVVLMENSKVLEDGQVIELKQDPLSQTGELLRSTESQSIELWRAQVEQDPLQIKRKRRELINTIIEAVLKKE